MEPSVVTGDLLDQDVEVIVNAWNRNLLPWWLLWLQGVSGAIKRRAGTAPFRELARMGLIPLGGAVVTGAGKLPFRAIIHVAGINLLWLSSRRAVRDSVGNALRIALVAGILVLAYACRMLMADARGGFEITMGGAMWFSQLWTLGAAACAWGISVLAGWPWWAGVLLFAGLFLVKSAVYRVIAVLFVGRSLPAPKSGGFSEFVKRSEHRDNDGG